MEQQKTIQEGRQHPLPAVTTAIMLLSSPIHHKAAFGPVVAAVPACYNGFDFTLLIEEILFFLVPSVILTLLLELRIFRFLRGRLCASTSKRLD